MSESNHGLVMILAGLVINLWALYFFRSVVRIGVKDYSWLWLDILIQRTLAVHIQTAVIRLPVSIWSCLVLTRHVQHLQVELSRCSELISEKDREGEQKANSGQGQNEEPAKIIFTMTFFRILNIEINKLIPKYHDAIYK